MSCRIEIVWMNILYRAGAIRGDPHRGGYRRSYKALTRGLQGAMGKGSWKRLFLGVLVQGLGEIKAKVLEMSASSGAYS